MESDGKEAFVEDDSDESSSREGLEELKGSGNEDDTDPRNIVELMADDFMNKEFESHEAAYDLYVKYAKFVGFGVRKGDVGRDEYGNLVRRRFFCNRAGLREKKHYMRVDRKRDHKPETRTNCLAKLSVYLDKSSGT